MSASHLKKPAPLRETSDETARPFSLEDVRAVRRPEANEPVRLGRLAEDVAKRYAARAISPRLVADVLLAGEWLLLASAALASLQAGGGAVPQGASAWPYVVIGLCGSLAGVATIRVFGGYDVRMLRKGLAQLAPVAAGWATVVAALLLGLSLLHQDADVPVWWLMLWYVSGLTVLMLVRSVLSRWVRRWSETGRMERRAVIVGGGAVAAKVIEALEADTDGGVRVCGIFDDRGDRRSPASGTAYPKLGNVRELVEFARRVQIDMLIVTIPLSAQARVLELLKSLWVLPLDIRLVGASSASSKTATGEETPFVHAFDKPIGDWGLVAKRVFDIVVASLVLVLVSPVLLATAIAVKLDSKGPVFFRQRRHGFNNRVIDIVKFRSMYADQADIAARKVVTRNDPRVTRLGRLLRKSSIDELPQLWNVIRGELSLVGPRPHAVHAISSRNETFIEIVDDYFGRHRVKPGITGWAQINGYRGEIDEPEKLRGRVDHDLHYIENWSILLDIAILAKTPFSLLKTENAY